MFRRALLFVLALLIPGTALAQYTIHNSDDVLSFEQLDYSWEGGQQLNTDIAEVTIDFQRLRSVSQMSTGYVNIRTSQDWVVQNMFVPVSPLEQDSVSIRFPLRTAVGVDVTDLVVLASFDANPSTNFLGAASEHFGVTALSPSDDGKGSASRSQAPAAPLFKGLPGNAAPVFYQPGAFKMKQTAHNQCGPMAVAVGLTYLEDFHGLPIPHIHAIGIENVNTDHSLVAEIGRAMNRNVTNRATGGLVLDKPIVEGKLKYLGNNGLGNVVVEHMDKGLNGEASFGNKNVNGGGLTSEGKGISPTFDFINDALRGGKAVELGFTRPDTSGHWVVVTAVGQKKGGATYVRFVEDALQTDVDATDTKGIKVEETELRDTNGDGLLNLVDYEKNSEVDIVVTELVVDRNLPGEAGRLIVQKESGTEPSPNLRLSWLPTCSTHAVDYGIYQGTLASLHGGVYDHVAVDCSDALSDLHETIMAAAGNRYYLVVPTDLTSEGSYGRSSEGVQRPAGAFACEPTQALGLSCP